MFERTASANGGTVNLGAVPTQNNATVDTLAKAMQLANGAATDLSGGQTFELRPIPDSLDITITSPDHVDGQTKTISLFNEDYLDASPARNSADGAAGAAAITIQYNDGRSGKLYTRMLENANGGSGLKIKSITCVAKRAGAADENFFASCDMKVLISKGEGDSTIPYNINWKKAINNQANKDGIYKIHTNFRLNYVSQLKFKQDKDTVVSLILEVDHNS